MVVVTRRRGARLGQRNAVDCARGQGRPCLKLQIPAIMPKTAPQKSTTRPYTRRRQQQPHHDADTPTSVSSDVGCFSGSSPNAGTAVAQAERRAIRPVDRQKMVHWLVEKLNAGQLKSNLWWVEKDKTFAVKWKHAASSDYAVKAESQIFKAWAEHSGRYQEGDMEDTKRWKSNFRSAMHSLKEVQQLNKEDKMKGRPAVRIYEILDKPRDKKTTRKSKNVCRIESSEDDSKGDDSDSGVSTIMDSPHSLPLSVTACVKQESSREDNLPNFQSLGISTKGMTCVQRNHLSGGSITINPCTTTTALTSAQPLFKIEPAPLSPSPSYPTPTSFLMPAEFLQEQLRDEMTTKNTVQEEFDVTEMKPVGIMTKSTTTYTRERTHSGDSGLPSTPPREGNNLFDKIQYGWQELADEGIDLIQEIEGPGTESYHVLQILSAEGLPPMTTASDIPEAVQEVTIMGDDPDFELTNMSLLDCFIHSQ